jgi:hypothetical protein
MYVKNLSYLSELFSNTVNKWGNFHFYPRSPKMSDLEVMALAIASEAASIDSEKLLFVILNSDYRHRFPNLIDRTRFNRRRRRLQPWFLEYCKGLGQSISTGTRLNIVDSMPCPVVRNAREHSFTICKENPSTAPRKGYSAVDRRYYIGYKLHLLIDEHGIFQDIAVTPANVHDINFLKELHYEDYTMGSQILADKGYVSATLRADLFTSYDIELSTPPRSNQKDLPPMSPQNSRKRRRIETQFSQLCDQFRMKVNYAKTYLGLLTRLLTKLAGMTALQKLNIEKGRPINHLKHAWS